MWGQVKSQAGTLVGTEYRADMFPVGSFVNPPAGWVDRVPPDQLPPPLCCKIIDIKKKGMFTLLNHKDYAAVKIKITEDMLSNMQTNGATLQDIEECRAAKFFTLDCHRLGAWENTGYAEEFLDAGTNVHATHACHRKACYIHAYFGSNARNIATEYCPAFMWLGGALVRCCGHNPPCLLPGGQSGLTYGTENMQAELAPVKNLL